ncbi:unnamed protein product [Haemonchus placei]|uniref:Protein ENL n=1 Tax=Haemonchus placei TaxID=6290 RepID=A0A0N4WN66_HAEPC|nr:unnamed protein product [Haemonchus placei]
MTSNVYTISFVLEKIHQVVQPYFELRLRFQGHDWCSVGEVETSDLPVGFTFTTILTSFKNSQLFTIDISLSNGSSFSAQLQLSKLPQMDVLSSRGMSVLYSTSHGAQVLAITLAVKITKYYHSPTQEYEIIRTQSETQTERIETRTVQVQVRRRCSTTASNTELHLLTATELEDTVANVVSQYLKHPEPSVQPGPSATEPVRPVRPSSEGVKKAEKPLNGALGKNLIPRLQKLRVLDRMIGERTALVEHFDANFVKQEIARKKAFILKCRMAKDDLGPPTKPKAPPSKASTKSTREIATQSEKVTSPSKSSTTSQTNSDSESSEESEESEDESEESASTSAEETSTSASSTSSSRETVLKVNHPTVPPGKQPVEKDERAEQTTRSSPPPLSPTSLYLKQLREKILKERMGKI